MRGVGLGVLRELHSSCLLKAMALFDPKHKVVTI
ncbi:MAG: hypothetical protein JG763_2650 [Shewanella sp.]|nr:hypothetical protein [Shewanella sp.]